MSCCRFLLIVTACLTLEFLLSLHLYAFAWFEFCTQGGIVTVSQKDCPFGVLYKRPQDIGNCWYPTSGDHIADVCTDDRDPDASKKIQFIDAGPDDEEGPASSGYDLETCRDNEGTGAEDKCLGEYVRVSKDNANGGEEPIDYPGDNDTMISAEDPNVDRTNIDVRQQTLRLFLYLSGLLADENENMPVIRLIRLLKKSFDILRKYCFAQYVPHDFTKEVLRSFLFLLRESDLAHVKDISVHEFAKINDVLERCLKGSPPNPFYLTGIVCKASSKVTGIIKTWGEGNHLVNRTHPIQKPNELSFKWGKYDVPIDAAWAVMDFTHGMCYGTFKDDMNSHHLYEQALERLFTPELVYRWARPIRLHQESFWDHMLRSYTDVAMRNMEACIQAAYIGSPYLHRLARPMVKQNVQQSQAAPTSFLSSGMTRKKRDVGSISAAWCFVSQEEKDEAMTKVKSSC